ncbi:MAG TPA: oligosaccharide flippase family protein [Blastocatellia bacterium]|nr:oligosaccharide flippase family protein [Blastocatellia bacterium]
MDRGHRLLRNISYNFLAQVWFLLLTLGSVPYIVRHLGADSYGLLSIITLVVGYAAVLDLGLGAAVIKYVAEYHARQDVVALRKLVGTALTLYILVGIGGALLMWILAEPLATTVFDLPPALIGTAREAFSLSSLGVLATMLAMVFMAIPQALQRFDLLVKATIGLGTTTVLGQVILLALGFSLREIVIFNVVMAWVGLGVFALVSKRLLPRMAFVPRWDRPTLARLLRFSGFKALSLISGHLVFQTDRLLIALFLPIAQVTYYAIPQAVAQRMLSLIPNITTALFPAVSEYQSETETLRDLYLRGAKSILLLVLPLTLVLVVMADKILVLWMGPDVAAHSEMALRLLAFGFFLASFSALPCVVAEGVGRPELPALFATLSAVLNLGFALLLIPRWGINGAALSLILNAAIQVPLFLAQVNRKIVGIRPGEYISRILLRPLLAAGPPTAFLVVAAPEATTWLRLALILLAGGTLYLVSCLLCGCIEPGERLKLKQYYTAVVRGSSR